jgi:hypothetical protein
MITIQIKPVEFKNFQTLALGVNYSYEVKKGSVSITAPKEWLTEYGFI